jgi:hypothetical protein
MNQKQKGMQPAFPAFPLQDQFGKFISPFGGFTKFEFIALQFYKQGISLEDSFMKSLEFMASYDEFISLLDEEQKTKLQIIQ